MSDILSDVLRAVRLTGAVFFAVDATGTWAAQSPLASMVAPLMRPGVEHVIPFHAVARGSCWAQVGSEELELHEGDLIVLPHGDPHWLSSTPGVRGELLRVALDPAQRPAFPLPVQVGGSVGPKVQLICGFLGCDARPFNPLLAALPRVLHVSRATREVPLLGHLIELAVLETGAQNPGRECALSRLSELMFVEAMRRYVINLPPHRTGWLAALSDDLVGRALSLLHDRPSQAWTIEVLAKEIGSSRSVLAERFNAVIDLPPMQYLAQWRMQLAAELLSATNAGLGEIAARVGYGSEAALSHAFKRMVGVSPARFREGERAGAVVRAITDERVQ